MSCGKTACVAGNASHKKGVFVVDVAANDASAKTLIILRWRDQKLPGFRGIEDHGGQIELGKDFMLAEAVQRLIRYSLKSFSQQNKADIAVLGLAARVGRKRDFECLTD